MMLRRSAVTRDVCIVNYVKFSYDKIFSKTLSKTHCCLFYSLLSLLVEDDLYDRALLLPELPRDMSSKAVLSLMQSIGAESPTEFAPDFNDMQS